MFDQHGVVGALADVGAFHQHRLGRSNVGQQQQEHLGQRQLRLQRRIQRQLQLTEIVTGTAPSSTIWPSTTASHAVGDSPTSPSSTMSGSSKSSRSVRFSAWTWPGSTEKQPTLRRVTSPRTLTLRELNRQQSAESALRQVRSDENLRIVYESQIQDYLESPTISLDEIDGHDE